MTDPDKRETVRAIEAQMWLLGRRIRRKISETAQEVAPGVGANGFALISVLEQRGPMRQQLLAEAIESDKGSMSRLVSELEEQGLVQRSPDPADGRAQLIGLTDLGRARMQELYDRRSERFARMMGDWTVEDLEGFRHYLTRYNDVWEN